MIDDGSIVSDCLLLRVDGVIVLSLFVVDLRYYLR